MIDTHSDALATEGDGPVDISAEMLNVIAAKLEEALADNRAVTLSEMRQWLSDGYKEALARAPQPVVKSVRDRKAAPTEAGIAFVLGNLSFAHLLATRADERRIDDTFEAIATDPSFAPYLNALRNGALSVGDLAREVDERIETVSRKLKKLRERGAVDFRRQGTVVMNFLTPAAEALARETFRQSSRLPKPRKRLDQPISDAVNSLAIHWRSNPNFSQESLSDDLLPKVA